VTVRSSNIAEMAGRHRRTARVTFIPEPEPDELFAPIVSVDDHALEPPSLFEGRLPARFADRAPVVRDDADGVPWWHVEDKRMPILFANGAAGRVMEEWKGASRCGYDEFRTSVSDPVARLADMDVAGIWASLNFGSTLWGFAGSRFARMKDLDLGLACLQAYNDWMIEEWCATDRTRFIACQLPWLADPEVAAAEIRRNAARGVRAVSFSENPEGLGFASLYSGAWRPFFDACAETGTVVNLHVGSSGRTANPSKDSPPEVIAALFPMSGIETVVDWIYARVPLEHPDLRIVLSEAGISWVPMVRERLRRAYRFRAASEVWLPTDPDPLEVLARNFWFASLEDPSGFRMLDLIGEDKVMVETDFPHMDSTWPGCQAMIRSELSHLARPTIAKVCYENACALYGHPLPPAEWIGRATMGPSPSR
jgi:predicted TIM-barrel fold metal-dependent hydrolase